MKNITILSIAILGAFAFSGCASKPIVAFNQTNKSEADKTKLLKEAKDSVFQSNK